MCCNSPIHSKQKPIIYEFLFFDFNQPFEQSTKDKELETSMKAQGLNDTLGIENELSIDIKCQG